MDKFHINAEGNPGKCSAKVKCPFGGDEVHYFSREAAQKAFEDATKTEALKVWKKKAVVAPESTPTTSQSGDGIGHGGFHGRATVTPPARPTPSRVATDLGHGRPSYGHGNW